MAQDKVTITITGPKLTQEEGAALIDMLNKLDTTGRAVACTVEGEELSPGLIICKYGYTVDPDQ